MFGDVFVHHTAIYAEGFRSLNTGEIVEFTVIQKEGKWHATSVTGPNGRYVEGFGTLYLSLSVVSLMVSRLLETPRTLYYTHTHTHTHLHA